MSYSIFGEDLRRFRFHEAVRATCFGIKVSVPNFYSIFELYYLSSGTFFTSIGELGLSLHEICEVSNLPMGSLLYKEYFPCTLELEQLEKKDSSLFERYREFICHFYIYLDVHHVYRNVNGLKSCANHLFPTLDDALKRFKFQWPGNISL